MLVQKNGIKVEINLNEESSFHIDVEENLELRQKRAL